jgi:hypothetical protein
MRHQRTFDVPDHLFRRKLSGSQNMNLFDCPTLTFYDFRGHNSRQRQDQLFRTLDREYAASDVVQIQFVSGIWMTGNWRPILQAPEV